MTTWTFLRQFLKNPTRLGSVIPSSQALARKVVEVADISDEHVVIELGAGTGPVTRTLLEHHPDLALVAFEPTRELSKVLVREVPGVDLCSAYADRDLRQHLVQRGWTRADRIVSGLPWTMWEPELQDEVLRGVVDALDEGGRFLTYTYVSSQARPAGRRFRRRLGRYFGKVWHTPVVWANVPPALMLVAEQPRLGMAANGRGATTTEQRGQGQGERAAGA